MNTAVTAVVPLKFYCQNTTTCNLLASWSKPGDAYRKDKEKDRRQGKDEGSDERVGDFEEREYLENTKEMCSVRDCDFLKLPNVGTRLGIWKPWFIFSSYIEIETSQFK